MADRFLVVIPVDPKAPLPETSDAVRGALANIAGTTQARVKDYGKLQFIDAGLNAQSITCPTCQQDVAEDQWHMWMQEDWHGAEGFHLHKHQMPCCGATLTVNDLLYDAPQGFARWFIGARTEREGLLAPEELSQLEAVAGLPLKAIAQRY